MSFSVLVKDYVKAWVEASRVLRKGDLFLSFLFDCFVCFEYIND